MYHHILSHGGPVLWAIGLTSLVALAVALERSWRLLHLRRACRVSHQAWADGGHAALRQADDPLARTVRAGRAHRHQGAVAMRSAGLDQVQVEVAAIERGLGVLATVAQVAPLLGLFGTVIGLMEAFLETSTADMVTAGLLAGGIFKALGTTAAGLGVAIPATLAYNALTGVAGRLVDELERVACAQAVVDRAEETP